jgi:RNAse (barnase) inhibitor barstar
MTFKFSSNGLDLIIVNYFQCLCGNSATRGRPWCFNSNSIQFISFQFMFINLRVNSLIANYRNSNSVTKYSYIPAYKIWKSVMIIQFITIEKYAKLMESNINNKFKGYIFYKIRDLDSLWNYVVNHISPDRTSIEYIGITVDRICRQSATSGRTISTFKIYIKQTKVSKISIWNA